MLKLQSMTSWLGVVFLLLLFFSLWYFLFRNDRSSGAALLPKNPCQKPYEISQTEAGDWQIFYYQKGCQALSSNSSLQAIGKWIEEDSATIEDKFALPKTEAGAAVLLSPDYGWNTYVSPRSAPAIRTLGADSGIARLYLDSALIELGLRTKYPRILKNFSLRRKVALSLALSLNQNAYINKRAPLFAKPEALLRLLDRCQSSACLAPLLRAR